ncbi:hypothetical protein D3C79_1119620 [compost metagenome]
MQLPRKPLPFLHDRRYPRLLGQLSIIGRQALQRIDLILPLAADPAELLTESAQLIVA